MKILRMVSDIMPGSVALYRAPEQENPVSCVKYALFIQVSHSNVHDNQLSQKNILVLYINLREEKDRAGFPARDEIPADILTRLTNDSEEDFTKKCHAFFAALFIGLRERISSDEDNVIQGWNDRMSQFGDYDCEIERRDFFRKVREHKPRHQMIFSSL